MPTPSDRGRGGGFTGTGQRKLFRDEGNDARRNPGLEEKGRGSDRKGARPVAETGATRSSEHGLMGSAVRSHAEGKGQARRGGENSAPLAELRSADSVQPKEEKARTS